MEQEVVITEKEDKDRWNEFVKANGSIFHLFEWGAIFEKSYGYKPLYFAAISKEEIKGVFPSFILGKIGGKRIVSIPLADYAGPLAADEKVLKLLLSSMQSHSKNNKIGSIEITTINKIGDLAKGLNYFTQNFTFTLDTNRPFEEVWKDVYHKKVRNMVRKSENNGIRVVEGNFDSELKDFYEIYVKTMLHLGGFPQTFSLFKEICKELHDYVKLFLAYYENKVIAGLLSFIFNKRMHIWSNASEQRFLKFGPNNAVYSHAIKWACENGLDCVDFGSTIPNTSHFFFKKRWGGDQRPIYLITSAMGPIEGRSRLLSMAKPIVSHMPVFIAKKVGGVVYKYY